MNDGPLLTRQAIEAVAEAMTTVYNHYPRGTAQCVCGRPLIKPGKCSEAVVAQQSAMLWAQRVNFQRATTAPTMVLPLLARPPHPSR